MIESQLLIKWNKKDWLIKENRLWYYDSKEVNKKLKYIYIF